MKIKNGFVSNSSTSSFIINPKDKDTVLNFLSVVSTLGVYKNNINTTEITEEYLKEYLEHYVYEYSYNDDNIAELRHNSYMKVFRDSLERGGVEYYMDLDDYIQGKKEINFDNEELNNFLNFEKKVYNDILKTYVGKLHLIGEDNDSILIYAIELLHYNNDVEYEHVHLG